MNYHGSPIPYWDSYESDAYWRPDAPPKLRYHVLSLTLNGDVIAAFLNINDAESFIRNSRRESLVIKPI